MVYSTRGWGRCIFFDTPPSEKPSLSDETERTGVDKVGFFTDYAAVYAWFFGGWGVGDSSLFES
jgi:hypothetical protein